LETRQNAGIRDYPAASAYSQAHSKHSAQRTAGHRGEQPSKIISQGVATVQNAMNERIMSDIDLQMQKILAPTGRLRVAVAVGSAISATWSKRDAQTGRPTGPTVDLANIFAARTNLPLTLVEYGSSGEIIQAASKDEWDVSFTPLDAERKTIVDFGPSFALGESTYMVPSGSGILNLADIDYAGARVLGVENTATIRAARQSLRNATVVGLAGLEEVLKKFRGGEADAVALGTESLLSILPEFPGARILDGYFLALGTAVAVPKGNAMALELFSRLLEELKADGTVRKILDKYGMAGTTVAPAGLRS
jgi:polar amino acid transport system substrate-binding protein